jgi:hypothetical protein
MREAPTPGLPPFGNPDGARSELTPGAGGASFIVFDDERMWGALATQPEDRRARIFVGRKGSGKTLFLRRMETAARKGSLYTVPSHEHPPPTEFVVDFCKRFAAGGHVVEKWQRLWHCAILRSLVSHLLKGPELSNRLGAGLRESISSEFTELLRDFHKPVSICSQAQELLQILRNVNEMNRFLYHPLWEDLRSVVADAIKGLPPLMFFVDAIDEAYDRAPWFWLRCQQGLLRAVMQLLHDPQLANQFHVIVSLRDVVFASVKDTEHGVRHADDTYFRVLSWGRQAIDYFLTQKLRVLDESYFHGRVEDGRTVANWIGISKIRNLRHQQDEPISDYLLRHTRMLPRDVVVLGNSLCQALTNKDTRTPEQIATCVRTEVSRCAAIFGMEQLRICSNEIVSGMIPEMTGTDQYSAFLENPALTDEVSADIRAMIRKINRNRFSRDELDAAQSDWSVLMSSKYDVQDSSVFEILWRNQLLGCRVLLDHEPKDTFFTDRAPGAGLPIGEQYLFHPIVTDTIGIEAMGDQPVVPYW